MLSFVSSTFFRLNLVFILLFTLSACSTTNQQASDDSPADVQEVVYGEDPRDPFEVINRPLWTFTQDYADKYVARPVSVTYAEVTPTPLRAGLYNISQHFYEPSTIINQLLLLELGSAAKATGRFMLNTTVGLFGFFDPAKDLGWERKRKSFGEVLGKYGVGDGPYFIIPGIKPTSAREEVGDFVDKYYWPFATLGFGPAFARWAISGMEKRVQLIEQEDMLNESVDSYEFVKNAYFQNMEFKVHDGNPPIKIDEAEEAELDSFLDEIDE